MKNQPQQQHEQLLLQPSPPSQRPQQRFWRWRVSSPKRRIGIVIMILVISGSTFFVSLQHPNPLSSTTTTTTITSHVVKNSSRITEVQPQQPQELAAVNISSSSSSSSSTPSTPLPSIPLSSTSTRRGSYHCHGSSLRLYRIEQQQQQQQQRLEKEEENNNHTKSRSSSSCIVTHSSFLKNETTTNLPSLPSSSSLLSSQRSQWSDQIAQYLQLYVCGNDNDNDYGPPSNNHHVNNTNHIERMNTGTRTTIREFLVITTDWNLYNIGNLSTLPSCILSVTAAGNEFPNSQLIVTPYELQTILLQQQQQVHQSQAQEPQQAGLSTSSWNNQHQPPEGTGTEMLRLPSFHDRPNKMVWRGNTALDPTGSRKAILKLGTKSSTSLPWLDVQSVHKSNKYKYKLTKYEMCTQYKYHLDIGGRSGTTWDSLRWKMKDCKALVFRIISPIGSKDWWHQYLKPFVHYIPVEATKESLLKWYNWAELHPIEAEQIAIAGQNISQWTSTQEVITQQMKTAFYHSCIPDPIEYQYYKDYCNNNNNKNNKV